jgi:hypothetical protein
MRLSYYPILQYGPNDKRKIGQGQTTTIDDDIVLDPPDLGGTGTGALDPPILSSSYNPGPGSSGTVPTPQADRILLGVVQYYKIDLYNTKSNLYGESTEKWYYPPYTINCNIERSDITFTDTEYGVDENQTINVFVTTDELYKNNITPEVGDIFVDAGRYFEVNGVNKILTPDQLGGFQTNGSPVYVIDYVITGYLTRTSKLNLVKYSS